MVIRDSGENIRIDIDVEEINQVSRFRYWNRVVNSKGNMEDEINEHLTIHHQL